MARLKRKFWLAPVSNGNISLMVDLARRNDFPWDAILGSEIAGDFKPKPVVYLAACAAFDLAPAQCMMVAAHSNDLAAAAQLGLRTAHTARVNEYGPTGEAAPTVKVDVAAKDLGELADKLGVICVSSPKRESTPRLSRDFGVKGEFSRRSPGRNRILARADEW